MLLFFRECQSKTSTGCFSAREVSSTLLLLLQQPMEHNARNTTVLAFVIGAVSTLSQRYKPYTKQKILCSYSQKNYNNIHAVTHKDRLRPRVRDSNLGTIRTNEMKKDDSLENQSNQKITHKKFKNRTLSLSSECVCMVRTWYKVVMYQRNIKEQAIRLTDLTTECTECTGTVVPYNEPLCRGSKNHHRTID